MKKKLKYLLLILGVGLIIFGALMPTIFNSGKSALTAKFEYAKKGTGIGNYFATITIISEHDFIIDSANITLSNAFNEYDIKSKSLNSLEVTKIHQDNEFIYVFNVKLTEDEFFDYHKVKSVTIQTNLGSIEVKESNLLNKSLNRKISWTIPVMIIVIVAGVGLVYSGISMIVSDKNNKKRAIQARKDLAKSNPEINTSAMTDEEVINKHRELTNEKYKEKGFWFNSAFNLNKEAENQERICSYCGALNDHSSKKCGSCGSAFGETNSK